MPAEFEVTEPVATEEVAVPETADAEVHRLIHKAEVRPHVEGEDWLDDLLPAVTIVHAVGADGETAYTVRRPSDGRFLSGRGFWHPRRYSARFDRNHTFSYEQALAKATEYALTLVPEGRATTVSVRVTNEWVSSLPFTDALSSEFQVEITYVTGKGFGITRGRRYLSKAGAWHRLGSTRRFNRNHFFPTQDEAVERATAVLPSLVGIGWAAEGLTLAEVLAGETRRDSWGLATNTSINDDWHDDTDNTDYPGYGDQDRSWGGTF